MLENEKKEEHLKSVYLNNISEAFGASKDTGVYVSCVFDIDLKKGEVSHYLASTDGSETIVIQKDMFKYDSKFKRDFLEVALSSYATEGIITVLQNHNHSLDPNPQDCSSLKSISSYNNIIDIRHGEKDYIKGISNTLNKIKTTGNTKLLFTNQKATGIIDSIVLAFLVGVILGGIVMLVLKFFV